MTKTNTTNNNNTAALHAAPPLQWAQQTIIGNVECKPWEYKLMMPFVTCDDAIKLKLL